MAYFLIFLKGIAIGVANVIPGVSGGTIAFITGIYERLIDALKSFNLSTLKLLVKGDLKAFAAKTDLVFLTFIFLGLFSSVLTVAKLFEYLFEFYPTELWSYFFGLIVASVFFIGRAVKSWNLSTIAMLIIGTATAVFLAFADTLDENDGFIYLIICGVVAICSMVLPGLSGSFVLIIMGNYMLVLGAISDVNVSILLPFGIGCAFGLIGFSNLLSWVFKKFHDGTIGLMTGFVLGSLLIVWPWKEPYKLLNKVTGQEELYTGQLSENLKVITYDWLLPDLNQAQTYIALMLIIIGGASVWAIEWAGKKKSA